MNTNNLLIQNRKIAKIQNSNNIKHLTILNCKNAIIQSINNSQIININNVNNLKINGDDIYICTNAQHININGVIIKNANRNDCTITSSDNYFSIRSDNIPMVHFGDKCLNVNLIIDSGNVMVTGTAHCTMHLTLFTANITIMSPVHKIILNKCVNIKCKYGINYLSLNMEFEKCKYLIQYADYCMVNNFTPINIIKEYGIKAYCSDIAQLTSEKGWLVSGFMDIRTRVAL